MAIHFLLPQTVAGYPIDFHETENGTLEIYVWRDEQRDERASGGGHGRVAGGSETER